MQFEVFTLLPEVFPSYLETSIIKRARERGLIDVRVHNIRDYTHDKHHMTDDTPYGGGGGMVMKPEPVFEAIESVLGLSAPSEVEEPPFDAAQGESKYPDHFANPAGTCLQPKHRPGTFTAFAHCFALRPLRRDR